MNIWKSKKGFDVLDKWAEFFFLILLIVGFIVSVGIGSAFFSYVVVFLFGAMAGRFLNYRKSLFPFYLVIIGLLIGYILGSRFGNWKVNLLFFIIGAAVSFTLHQKKILK